MDHEWPSTRFRPFEWSSLAGRLIVSMGNRILGLPTLVRRRPELVDRIIGDRSLDARVLVGLNVQPVKK